MVEKSFSVILCTILMVIFSTKLASSEYDSRIVGGQSVDISNRPFQLVVIPNGYVCGGSLIKANAVLTAAHCVENISPSNIKVRAGSNYYYKDGVLLTSVIQNVVHNDYNPNTMDNDIAILKISSLSSFMFSYSIATIPLATILPPTGTSVVVSGYGTLSSGGSLANNLQQVTVGIIDWNICNNKYGNQLTAAMFCAAAPNKDSCQGDSGGPITYDGKLIGVVSWGYGCADTNYPGVYTDVLSFNSWIHTTTAPF